MYKLGWFATSRGQTSGKLLQAVLESIRHGETRAEIEFVFSNREPGEGENSDRFFEMVRQENIPLVCFSSRRFKAEDGSSYPGTADGLPAWRREYDRAVMERLAGFDPDLCVLAGYMLIVGREMCQHYRMLNLHPAEPGGPAGTWQEVIWQLIEAGASRAGAMMHLVTPELDKGPAVTYFTFPIRGETYDRHWREVTGRPVKDIIREQGEANDLFQLIRAGGVVRELPLVVASVRAFSDGRVAVTKDHRVVNGLGQPIKPRDLTEEINRMVAASPTTE